MNNPLKLKFSASFVVTTERNGFVHNSVRLFSKFYFSKLNVTGCVARF